MKRAINRLILEVAFMRWAIVTMFRQIRGRWFVFRDAPDWFIKLIGLAHINREFDDDPALDAYGEAAREERKLRRRNAKREAERARSQ